jgi:hypothetical protein
VRRVVGDSGRSMHGVDRRTGVIASTPVDAAGDEPEVFEAVRCSSIAAEADLGVASLVFVSTS